MKDDDKDPIKQFERFSKIGPGLKDAGDGVSTLAKSFDLFKTDNLEKIGAGLNKFLGAVDMNKLTAFSKASGGLIKIGSGGGNGGDESVPALITETNRLLKTGLFGSGALLAELQTETNDLGGKAASATVVVTNNSSQQINQSKAMVLPPSPIVAGNGQSTLDT
jgi:hypothetical protein